MNKIRFTMKAFAFLAFTIACVSAAHAQATRTWVSGVGDDANPCSRTAPCKTFPGAISKTALGGEIDALDPGGFGTITITKAITIDGGGGIVASILASGVPGVTVNAGVNDNVILRNLKITGINQTASPGTIGVRYIAGKAVSIENCFIFGFSSQGVSANLTADGGQLLIRDTIIENSGGDGVNATTSVGQIKVSLDGVRVDKNVVGIHVVNNASVMINNCESSMNSSHGVQIENNTSANIDHSTIFGNTGMGLNAGAGAPTVRISDVSILNNAAGGVNLAGGTVFTFGDNKIRGSGGVGDINGGSLNGSTTKQ